MKGFPDGSESEESACNAGNPGSIHWVRKIPVQLFLPGETHRQGSLAGYSPQGHKKLGTTERLILHEETSDKLPRGHLSTNASRQYFILFLLTPHLPWNPHPFQALGRHLPGLVFLMMATPSLPFPHSDHQMRLQPLCPHHAALVKVSHAVPSKALLHSAQPVSLSLIVSLPGVQNTGLSYYLCGASFLDCLAGSLSLIDPFSSPSPLSLEVIYLTTWLNTIYVFNVRS